MKKNLKSVVKILLWMIAFLVGLAVIYNIFLSIRYSPAYMLREIFFDIGNAYDFKKLPERKLTANPDPFLFNEDKSKETQVQELFQSNPAIPDLDAFLEENGTQAFLVIQNDTIIYERYFMGYQRDSIVTSMSEAKSFDSAMIGMAIEDGYIHSAQDPITDYLPELLERDARFKDIQIRHLLMMASGLRYQEEGLPSTGDGSLTYGFPDLRHLALTETEVVEAPGVTFVYNNYNPLLLGLILERATGKTVTGYLQEKIWTPLEMEFDGSWSLDSEESGFEKMESGINARAIDFAKFGRLYLNGGEWNGKQIVPAEWVKQSTQSDLGRALDEKISYGYMWWEMTRSGEANDFFALGNFGQFIYVSPFKNLIIVRNGDQYGLDGEWSDWVTIFHQFASDLDY